MRSPNRGGGRKDTGPRINQKIQAEKIRLLDADGEMAGVVTVEEGLELAADVGMDLVEVSPNADPPVCKILDYGKYKYEQQKKANEARKKQKVVAIKEVKLRPNIDSHDLEIKMRNVHKFLDAGDKVKLTLRFRGREMRHQELGVQLMQKVREELGDLIKVEHEPSMMGRQIIMVVSSAK